MDYTKNSKTQVNLSGTKICDAGLLSPQVYQEKQQYSSWLWQ